MQDENLRKPDDDWCCQICGGCHREESRHKGTKEYREFLWGEMSNGD